MTIELIKEHKPGDNPWYELRANGKYVMGSYTLERVENAYDELKNGKNPFLSKEVLRSEEINLSLDETN
jgi:hypothetical protein